MDAASNHKLDIQHPSPDEKVLDSARHIKFFWVLWLSSFLFFVFPHVKTLHYSSLYDFYVGFAIAAVPAIAFVGFRWIASQLYNDSEPSSKGIVNFRNIAVNLNAVDHGQ
jgi:hypothetical protein